MKKRENKHKLWQSMINLDLTPDEFIYLKALGQIREQSLRQLVSNILRQEMKAFNDIIQSHVDTNVMLPSLEANASKKRLRGRPRLKDERVYTKARKEEKLPTSMLQLIEDQIED
jgi:hypothetical protein